VTAAPALTKILKFKVTVSNGRNQGQSFVFDKPVITVGRGPENDLVFGQDQRMSRSHFEIIQQDGKLKVKNISQKNYLLVNEEKTEETWLTATAFVQAGDTQMQIQFETVAEPVDENKTMAVAFQNDKLLQAVPQAISPAVAAPVLKMSVNTDEKASPVSAIVKSKSSPMPAPKSSAAAHSQPPPPPNFSASSQASRSRSAARARSSSSNSRVRFYGIIAIVAAGLGWMLMDGSAKKKAEVNIRTEGDVSRAIQESAMAVQEIQKKQSAAGQDSAQYKAAQEHYIRGFRDYRQGQYARSMQSFQAALSFYPNHELARKYYVQAQRKFEAQIDFAMSQGRKYYQKNNYKMCQSSFASVMIMVKDSSKPKYKEAKQFYEECSLRSEGRI
jgi:tetratricopeptide (TPR) repeat protein